MFTTPNKWLRLFTVGAAVFLFLTFAVYSFKKEFPGKTLPVLGQVRDFTLTDVNGEGFGLKKLLGRVWVANFFFTTCSDICPIMNKNMAALTRSFELVRAVDFVSISVNPEHDSPTVLKQYAEKYQATKRWHFLTGSRDVITDLAVKSFNLGDIKEPVFHSAYFSLVDRYGNIRGYYDGTKTEGLNRLFKDAAKLLKEK